jgi:hypothetical protein
MPDFIKTTGRGLMQLKHITVRSAGAAPARLGRQTDSNLGQATVGMLRGFPPPVTRIGIGAAFKADAAGGSSWPVEPYFS